ncbi:MAG: plastocyanin/azurin family copper-binding protein [Halobacteriales archaeon]
MDRRSFLALAGSTGVALAGCSGDNGGNGVEMTDEFAFDPETITVGAGETVTWENVGSVGHTVTAYEGEIPEEATYFASGGFDSEDAARENLDEGLLEGGETFSHTFEVAGEYAYFCVPHEGSGMTGTVRVEG